MSEYSVFMHLQGLRPEAHAPTCPPSCASERDHFKILKHTVKIVGRKISGAEIASIIKPPPLLYQYYA